MSVSVETTRDVVGESSYAYLMKQVKRPCSPTRGDWRTKLVTKLLLYYFGPRAPPELLPVYIRLRDDISDVINSLLDKIEEEEEDFVCSPYGVMILLRYPGEETAPSGGAGSDPLCATTPAFSGGDPWVYEATEGGHRPTLGLPAGIPQSRIVIHNKSIQNIQIIKTFGAIFTKPKLITCINDRIRRLAVDVLNTMLCAGPDPPTTLVDSFRPEC